MCVCIMCVYAYMYEYISVMAHIHVCMHARVGFPIISEKGLSLGSREHFMKMWKWSLHCVQDNKKLVMTKPWDICQE